MSTIIIIAVAVVVLGYAFRGTFMRLTGKGGCCGGGELVVKKSAKDKDASNYPYKYKMHVEGMKCANCVASVNNAINEMGDTWAQVNLEEKSAVVLSKSEKTEENFVQALKKTKYKISDCEQVK